MEAAGQIDMGAIARLRKQAKAAQKGSYQQIQMLANALAPAVSLDAFLPQQKSPTLGPPAVDALLHKPTLVVCCDEERKQNLGWTQVNWIQGAIITSFAG